MSLNLYLGRARSLSGILFHILHQYLKRSFSNGPFSNTTKAKIASHGKSFIKMIYYSTIASFYHIWSRERAKYETVIHCSVPV